MGNYGGAGVGFASIPPQWNYAPYSVIPATYMPPMPLHPPPVYYGSGGPLSHSGAWPGFSQAQSVPMPPADGYVPRESSIVNQYDHFEQSSHAKRRMMPVDWDRNVQTTSDKQAQYLRELDEQVRMKQQRKLMEREAERLQEEKLAKDINGFDHWAGRAPQLKGTPGREQQYKTGLTEMFSNQRQPEDVRSHFTQLVTVDPRSQPQTGYDGGIIPPEGHRNPLIDIAQETKTISQDKPIDEGHSRSFLRMRINLEPMSDVQKEEAARKQRAFQETQDYLKKQIMEREAEKKAQEERRKLEEQKEAERQRTEQDMLRVRYEKEQEEIRTREEQLRFENEKQMALKVEKERRAQEEAQKIADERQKKQLADERDKMQSSIKEVHAVGAYISPQSIPHPPPSPPIPTIQRQMNQNIPLPPSPPIPTIQRQLNRTHQHRENDVLPPLRQKQPEKDPFRESNAATLPPSPLTQRLQLSHSRDVVIPPIDSEKRNAEYYNEQSNNEQSNEDRHADSDDILVDVRAGKEEKHSETVAVLRQLLDIQRGLEKEQLKVRNALKSLPPYTKPSTFPTEKSPPNLVEIFKISPEQLALADALRHESNREAGLKSVSQRQHERLVEQEEYLASIRPAYMNQRKAGDVSLADGGLKHSNFKQTQRIFERRPSSPSYRELSTKGSLTLDDFVNSPRFVRATPSLNRSKEKLLDSFLESSRVTTHRTSPTPGRTRREIRDRVEEHERSLKASPELHCVEHFDVLRASKKRDEAISSIQKWERSYSPSSLDLKHIEALNEQRLQNLLELESAVNENHKVLEHNRPEDLLPALFPYIGSGESQTGKNRLVRT
ncbi:hypothetical protein BJ742DRAFT_807015 [Cladochytrium replicatum]|nr:hypothetical protein BJ742DRAFT_807015 [Cladochytrium replicatum]